MTPAEQVFMIMQQLPAEQQQAALHFVRALQTSPFAPKVTTQVNQSVIADIEQRADSQRMQREMWGDDDM